MLNSLPDNTPGHTQTLLKLGQPAEDTWFLSRDAEVLPEKRPAIVPLALWREAENSAQLAPWLPSDSDLSVELASRLEEAPLVAIDFPVFTDGRGYTLARLLRERFHYQGEVRAIGDVLVDQLYYMTRCGFDALALREDQQLDDAQRALSAFSISYQPGIDSDEPLFTRRLREAALK
ncbi:DUF934 domain-containing protein [Halomonas sp. WWR20]